MIHLNPRHARGAAQVFAITGGGGFVGAHLVRHLLAAYPNAHIKIIDALTYAGDMRRLKTAIASGRVSFVKGDIGDDALMGVLLTDVGTLFHLAAESHVSRSFNAPELFDRTNRVGTRSVMRAAVRAQVPVTVHVSTDEVYGTRHEPADETARFAPSSPYSRSKAAAEAEVEAARRDGLDVRILRPSNIVGTGQNIEKLLPRFALACLSGEALTLEGSGLQRRTFLPVEDFCNAADMAATMAPPNSTYNVCGLETRTVREIGALIGDVSGMPVRFTHIEDRPVNDQAYEMDASRLHALGWRQRGTLREEIIKIIDQARAASQHSMRSLDKVQPTPPLVPERCDIAYHAKIAFHVPFRAANERLYVGQVLSGERLAAPGTQSEAAATAIQKLVKAPNIWLTNSCTAALEVAALSLNLGPGDEVIIPAFTFAATATAFARTGARIVFCDIDPVTLMINPIEVRRKMNSHTRAVVAVHYGGGCADVASLASLCAAQGVALIEDAAQSFGCQMDDKSPGTTGLFGAISFHDTKVVNCGQGGALIANTSDPEIISRIESIMNRGTDFAEMRSGRKDSYEWVAPGSSFRMPELEAAILCAQLDELPAELKRRAALASLYMEKFVKISGPFSILHPASCTVSNHHIMALLCNTAAGAKSLMSKLQAHGISAQRHYTPLNLSPEAKRRGETASCPVTESVWRRLVRLPIHTAMRLNEVDRVTACVDEWARSLKREPRSEVMA